MMWRARQTTGGKVSDLQAYVQAYAKANTPRTRESKDTITRH